MRHMASALLVGCMFVACGDSTAPTVEQIAGSYAATTFNTTEDGVVTDQLALGASIQVTLGADNTTTGRIFVPDAEEGGGDFDMDLTGTWALDSNDGSVAFEHASDTFLRDMTFSYFNSRLSGEATFSGVAINVVLRK